MADEPGIDRIRREWEARARSPYRDFFVASHRGWQDADAWRHQAEMDVAHLFTRLPFDHPEGLGAVPYRELDVLEIGCGVGRLAAVLAPRVRSYGGFDFSPSMVARAREGAAPNCAFWVNDGLTFPTEIGARKFGLVFALAVFIHCPKSVCASLIAEARRVLAAGGQFRGHFLCDQNDLEGLAPPSSHARPSDGTGGSEDASVPPPTLAPSEEFRGHVEYAAAEFLEGTAYTGHLFRVPELRELITAAGFTDIAIARFDPVQMYVAARP